MSAEKANNADDASGAITAGICGCCYTDAPVLVPAPCDEKPEELAGAPIGMYHCPDCGAMVLAGVKHPDICEPCAAKVQS